MRRTLIAAVVLSGAFALVGCGADVPPPQPPPSAPAVPQAPLPPPAAEPAPPPAPAYGELQLASLKAATEAINAHDAKRYAGLFTSNAIHREAAAPDIVGREGIAARMELLFASFPDLRFAFTRLWQKGNVAVATWRWTGTDTGGFLGKKPTGRSAGLEGATIGWYNDDGSIREVRVYEDGQTVVDQLDAKAKKGTVRPPPAEGPAMDTVAAGPDEVANTRAANLFYDAIEGKKETDILGLFNNDSTADDYAMSPGTVTGLRAWKAMYRSWTAAFPDSTQLPLVNQLAVGDYVISERVVHATHKGPVGRVGPTGLPVSIHCLDIIQLKDGKIARFATWSNTLELLAQVRRPARSPESARKP